jgi:hypothetical protein
LALITIAIIWAALAVIAAMVDPVGWGDHLANLAVVLSLLAGAGYCRRLGTAPAGQRLLMVLSWVGGLGWLASVLVHGTQGQVVVSVIWAAAAGGAIVAGIRLATPLARQLGMATLAVVLVKLLTVDLSEVDTLWRVGLFLVIGAGLLRLGYLVPKLTQHREPQ